MAERRHSFGQKWGDDPFTALGYTQTPNALIKYASRLGLKSEECWLIVCILRFKYDQNDPMPSQSLLAELFGQSVDTIQRTVQKIVKKGLLNVERVRSDHGHFTHTIYDFTPLRNALNQCYLSDHPQDKTSESAEIENGASAPQICGLDNTADAQGRRNRKHAVLSRPQTRGTKKKHEESEQESISSKTLGVDAKLDSAAAELAALLISNEVNRADAFRLAIERPEECRRQLKYLPFVKEFKNTRGAWLRAAIEGEFAAPKGYVDEIARRENHQLAEERAQILSDEKEAKRKRIAQLVLEAKQDPNRWAEIEQVASGRIPELFRSNPERAVYRNMLNGYIAEVLLEINPLKQSS